MPTWPFASSGSAAHAPRTRDFGSARYGAPPRGVRKADYSSKNLFDVWFPNLAPSEALLKEYFPIDESHWPRFRRRFLKEMQAPTARRDIELLAALSGSTHFSVGCYCENELLCHRSLLRELLEQAGAEFH